MSHCLQICLSLVCGTGEPIYCILYIYIQPSISEWTEPHVKKDDHPSSQTSSSNRHRCVISLPIFSINIILTSYVRARREQPDEGQWIVLRLPSSLPLTNYTDSRPMFKSQFSQASQMGNFRHHPSRLDDKGDRDSHERLRNVSVTLYNHEFAKIDPA